MKPAVFVPATVFFLAATAHADMQVHDLPLAVGEEVAGALQAVIGARCSALNTHCTARRLTDNRFIVEAPTEVQAEIATMLETIIEQNPAATPRVTLHYWVLVGEEGRSNSSSAALEPLEPVMRQIQRLNGQLGFRIAERASLATVSGQRSAVSADPGLGIRQYVWVNGSQLSAQIELQYLQMPEGDPDSSNYLPPFENELQASVSLEQGEFLVLGETGAAAREGRYYYIVHWPE